MKNAVSKSGSASVSFYILAAVIAVCALLLCGCGGKGGAGSESYVSPYSGRETADLSGYDSMFSYDGESRLVDTTVAEIDQLMKDGETFIFAAAYEDCEYCDLLMPYLNDFLAEHDTFAGYLDTRKDPGWMNNTDIDDYDIFVKRFSKVMDKDKDGSYHLYTPDLYMIKNGRIAAEHQGVINGADDPETPLTQEQEAALRDLLEEMYSEME